MATVIDTTLFGLLHDYLKIYLPQQCGCSKHTMRSYRFAINSFLDFARETHGGNSLSQVTFKTLSSEMLAGYLDSLEAKGNSISTRNLRRNCINAFLAYAAKVDSTTIIHKAELSKVPKKNLSEPDILKYLSEKGIAALLAQPNPFTQKGMRDRFILLLMYDTGVRLSELVGIRLKDIRLGKAPVVGVVGKNDKYREVPIMKQTVEHFKNYCSAYHRDEVAYSDSPLFYMWREGIKTALDESTVRKLCIAYAGAARENCADVPEKVTPHMLRHSRAMHLYQHGMDLTLVSQWLGHSQLETTLIYAHADTEQKRGDIEKATPKNSPLRKRLNPKRYSVTDDDTLRKLYGLA